MVSTRSKSSDVAVALSANKHHDSKNTGGHDTMASLKRVDSRNSVVVPTIQIGVLPGTAKNASEIATSISQIAPDRFEVTLLGGDEANTNSLSASSPASWPAVEVLIVLCSAPETNDVARDYIASAEPNVILSDWNIDRITSDRRIFYDILEAHRDAVISGRLPMRLYAGEVSKVIVRREHLEIDGRIILKPCMERAADASDDDFRIYYPASSGGGCKFLKTGRFDGKINDVRTDGPCIYEELVEDADAAAKFGQDQRRYRKRDRMLDAAYKFVPGLGKSGDIPRYDDDDEINPDSDLTRLDRKIYVVTTASLPWMTGTAVNPLLRAAYLSRGRSKGSVTLVIPWLSQEEDRKKLYAKYDFKTPADQEAHVREWLRDKAQMPDEADSETGIQILWYESRYHPTFMSIFSVEDICERISDEDADVCVLEEPEHLNWFRAQGDPWTKKFNFTVGIVHTNYKQYAKAEVGGFIAAPIIAEMSSLMVRAYCNKVIKLSPVLQTFSPEKEVICNVHGVRGDFIMEGERRAKEARDFDTGTGAATQCYFIGKILWAKGLDKLMHLEHYYRKTTGSYFNIDIVGDGPELEEIRRAYLGRATANREMISYERVASSTFDFDPPKSIREFRRTPIPAQFLGRKEHFEHAHGNKYKIFINPSITEVLCTTTAEALAMGKFAIIPVSTQVRNIDEHTCILM
mmetsp:Transcript_9629/g.26989  ORF Transcript_9629/g.26989 Transcript_9629/m.26989 type:complete len:690 (-) Transcript_9629:614-2683(-)